MVDQTDANKADLIEERKANLPLPVQPPVASDFNSADASTVNVGSGRDVDQPFSKGTGSLREPATGDPSYAGRQAADGLSGLPNDAVSREAKNKPGLADTTGKDYGYPGKNDPSKGL